MSDNKKRILVFPCGSEIGLEIHRALADDCMFSSNIKLYNTDAHPIFDKNTEEIINKVKGIKIGRHSWIGYGVSILKNSIVPDNSIIGWQSVFTGVKTKPYCAFAGNPAKCVKENVTWDTNGAKAGYIDNEINKGNI